MKTAHKSYAVAGVKATCKSTRPSKCLFYVSFKIGVWVARVRTLSRFLCLKAPRRIGFCSNIIEQQKAKTSRVQLKKI